jgi:hypothetical protein
MLVEKEEERKKGIERVKLGLFRRHRRLLGVKWNFTWIPHFIP